MISKKDITKGKVVISACAIIESKDHEVLFIHEGDMPYHNWWVLPGGYVRPDETVEQAVIREVKEETGLVVASTKFLGLYEDFFDESNEQVNHIIIAYQVEVVGGRIIFSPEATAYKWLTIDGALASLEIPGVFKKIIEKIRKNGRKHLFSRRQTL